ncbi:4-hydroxy-tetrahydrodipicolinate synthase [Alkalicoccus urumqiensis]|uniref:4-hydroxy-tetrahydrodipicolinate synthase n=1 Tax=Alkalicoccus urumqiensis TaxID=1548213 RepID=A0A2P6MKV9_ALKUR|nr:4-hydroxy-tetrahydrodipicolinate synthase [Alkalicoccus urumqiensis]PRO66903.1 4-hydroxy-tetrahydrodipicolinate synthase [Alkalicoccus urumqiensis]
MNFGQVVTAMVTPFDDNGYVDVQGLRTLVNYLIDNGSDAIVVAGTTGEAPTLTHEEKAALFKNTVEFAGGRIPVIAGAGTNSTHAACELVQLAEQAGADAVMLSTPYYNKPSQEGMYQHFMACAGATNLPIMLYNVPGRTGVHLTAETTSRLAYDADNIVSLKDASGDLDHMTAVLSSVPASFTVYSGDDSLTLPALSIGASGIVSVSSHIIGTEMQAMINAHFSGQPRYAASLHRDLVPVMDAMFCAPSPAPVKAALELTHVHAGSVRLPLQPLSETEQHFVFQTLKRSLFSSSAV